MRDASKIAPGPMSERNTCDECAVVPVTRRVHDVVPRRDVTAKRGSPGPSSKPIAAVAPRAALTSAAREAASGRPGASSSPVMTTATFRSSSAPAAARALSACTITTSPPFMSMMPGPRASVRPTRSNF